MSSRGLIWSTSKSLGFFLLITADQALSRFSLFKSAFNISLMLDVPHQTIGLWGHRGLWPAQARGHHSELLYGLMWPSGGHTGSALCLCWPPWEGAVGSHISSCSCQWSLGPSGYSSVPEARRGTRAPWLGCDPPACRWVCRAVSKGSLHRQGSTEESLQQFWVCTQPYLQLLFEKWTLPTFRAIRKLTQVEVKFFFQPVLCACSSAEFQYFCAPASIQAVRERQFHGILRKLQKMFLLESVWMAEQMGPEMWLYLKAVLSLDVTIAVFQHLVWLRWQIPRASDLKTYHNLFLNFTQSTRKIMCGINFLQATFSFFSFRTDFLIFAFCIWIAF